jgi:nucleotide-binding universal stress UspA family protein
MIPAASILCPIDFSESSRGALRQATAIASRFSARLTLLAVHDPLLAEAAELQLGAEQLTAETIKELETFYRHSVDPLPEGLDVRLECGVGKPAPEILRLARERACDLIVMASGGATGFRKLFFGSTTERVLRETMVPVLVTYGTDAVRPDPADLGRLVRRVLVPVDLTEASEHQVLAAGRVAEALHVPLLLLHVVEPVRMMIAAQPRQPKIDAERRYRAERKFEAAAAMLPASLKPETLVAFGEPAEEIAKVAADRGAGLIVMGLHSSPMTGPRMGSVTYRVLCLAHRLVLALPPQPAPSARLGAKEDAATVPARTS